MFWHNAKSDHKIALIVNEIFWLIMPALFPFIKKLLIFKVCCDKINSTTLLDWSSPRRDGVFCLQFRRQISEGSGTSSQATRRSRGQAILLLALWCKILNEKGLLKVFLNKFFLFVSLTTTSKTGTVNVSFFNFFEICTNYKLNISLRSTNQFLLKSFFCLFLSSVGSSTFLSIPAKLRSFVRPAERVSSGSTRSRPTSSFTPQTRSSFVK